MIVFDGNSPDASTSRAIGLTSRSMNSRTVFRNSSISSEGRNCTAQRSRETIRALSGGRMTLPVAEGREHCADLREEREGCVALLFHIL